MTATQGILMVPVDDTQVSEKVLQYVLSDVYRNGDEIRLFHVIPTPMPEYVAGGIDMIFTMEPNPAEDIRHIREAKEFCQRRFVPVLESKKVPYKVEIVHFLTEGAALVLRLADEDSIGEAVCKRAEKLRPRMVTMAKHTRGRIKEFFLGSAAKYTVTHCKFPVLILHEEALGGSSSSQDLTGAAAGAGAGAGAPPVQLHEA